MMQYKQALSFSRTEEMVLLSAEKYTRDFALARRHSFLNIISTWHSISFWTRSHSSRMRTARLLTVFSSMHCAGGVSVWGACLVSGGGVGSRGGGVYPSMHLGRPQWSISFLTISWTFQTWICPTTWLSFKLLNKRFFWPQCYKFYTSASQVKQVHIITK